MDNNDYNRYTYQVERPTEALKPKKKHPALMLVSLFLVFTLVVGGTGGVVGYYLSQNNTAIADTPDIGDESGQPVNSVQQPSPNSGSNDTLPVITPAASQDGALSIQDIFARGDKSTVAISTMTTSTNVFGQPVSQAAAGSGFILTDTGYVLTNHHVIDGASEVIVILYDGSEYPAEIIGSDAVTDIAVLKINTSGLNAVKIGDSDKLAVGDQVVAIGNPLGELANSLTVGYISAKKRIVSIDDIPRVMLQTDASVSPGNSGGPLFNLNGEVIGVVAAKTVSSGVEGIGFAIPINIAADIANQLIRDGRIVGRPLLGISYQEISSLQNSGEYPEGVYVAAVNAGSAAEKAGIKQGDVITHFDGVRITEGAELQIEKNLCRVGDTITVIVWRNGTEVTLSVTFDTEMPETTIDNSAEQEQQQSPFNPWGR